MADRVPLLTTEWIAATWRKECEPERHGTDLVESFARVIEEATRAPLLAEIERLTQESLRWITKLNAVHVSAREHRDRIRELTLYSEGVEAQRRAAQEQVEKLQAEVARLEPMRQRADDIERLTAELASLHRNYRHHVNTITNWGAAMQAACIAEREEGAEAGMRWVRNTLAGPGLLPKATDQTAQAFFDAAMAAHEAWEAAHPIPHQEPTNG